MRQLGARLPEPPPLPTDVETPPETDRTAIERTEQYPVVEQYPVEVHRIEPRPIGSSPAEGPRPEAAQVEIRREPSGARPEPSDARPEPIDARLEPSGSRQEPGGARQESIRIYEDPSGEEPRAAQPSREEPSRAEPSRAEPRVAEPRVAEPKVPEPRGAEARSAEPSRIRQGTGGPPRETHGQETHGQETDGAGSTASARWAEFHDFRQIEPGRGGRLNLGGGPHEQSPSWDGFATEREREHHFPFLTLAVPGIAAILAVGALVWSGSLRDRVHRQDAAMTELQQQNQKLSDMLAEMNVEQKASTALNSSPDASPDAAGAPAGDPLQKPANGPTAASQQAATPTEQAVPAQSSAQAGTQSGRAGSPPAGGNEGASARRGSARQSSGYRQGVATPQAPRSSARAGSGYRQPMDMGYAPEIVPPYPTNFRSGNVAADAASSQPVPHPETQYPSSGTASGVASGVATPASPAARSAAIAPTSVPQSSHASAAQQSHASMTQQRPPAAPGVNNGAASSTSYTAAGNGQYISPLAQNIETVESMQRHSTVPLKEFHVQVGTSVKVTPAVGLSVRSPDQGHGTYALVVNQGGGSYQLRGAVNNPLVFADNATHREYALVVLRIADQQVYGYLRSMQ